MKKIDYSLDDMKADAADAFTRAAPYHAELKEAYRYYAPWRIPTTQRAGNTGGKSEGARLGTEMLFDSTGLSSQAAFVANMQADWMPHFEPIFKAEAGPLFPPAEKDAYNLQLELATNVVHGLLGKTRVRSLDLFQDLFFGTGALLMEPGPKNREPIRSVAVPPLEIAMTVGPWGDLERWFWKRNHKVRHLEEMWPDAKWSKKFTTMFADKSARNTDVEVHQYTYWCEQTERFELRVWTNIDATILKEASTGTSSWITPRLFTSPGDAMGRGFAQLGLPTLKSLNKGRELALRAAAFALLGLWVRRHDGVFNPDTAAMVPGAMWKVAHTSGPLKSIERLPVPNNFDVAQFVMKDEREQFRRVVLDDELPELADRVRSPTEIAGRMRRYDRNRGGNTVRLAQEMIVPLGQRSFEIAEGHGLLPTNLRIDQMGTQVTVAAPAALAARSAKVERTVAWLQMVTSLFGPQAVVLAGEVEKIIPEMARWIGVEESLLRTKAGTKELKEMVAQYAAQIVASEQAKTQQAKAQTTTPESSQYINGAI